MVSLARLVEKLKQQKLEAAKIRRKKERMLKQAKQLQRRSSSGLHFVEKKLEDTRERMGEINVEFNQILARKDSLERLIKAAEDRLKIEDEAKEQAQIDLENADSPEAKQAAADRLKQINEKIQELKTEIKQRQSAAKKIVSEIEEYKKSKLKTSQTIHKHTHVKPELISIIRKTKIDTQKLQKKLDAARKREELITKNLQKVLKKLEEIRAKQLAKRRKVAALAAAKRRAAKKRMLAKRKAARKSKTKNKKSTKSKIKKRR